MSIALICLLSHGNTPYLKVIVSDDLKLDKQCVAAVKKANRLLGMIKHNFIDRSKAAVLALYKSLIRPHLESWNTASRCGIHTWLRQ